MPDPSNPLMVLGKVCRSGKSLWCCFSLFSLPCQMSGPFTNISSLFLGWRGDSIVSIMTRLWAGRSCSNFSRCKRCLSQNVRSGYGFCTASFEVYPGSFLGLSAQGVKLTTYLHLAPR